MTPRRQFVFATLAIAFGSILAFAAAETGLRLVHRDLFDRENTFDKFLSKSKANCLITFDDKLGWTVGKNFGPSTNSYGTRVTSDGEGFRKTTAPANDAAPWLAIGDSFTFGDEVSDDESWPAALQAQTGNRVLNAGVCGYGIDQALLRMEQVVPRVKPPLVVFSIFALQPGRNELVAYPDWQHAAPKPYFRLVDGKLTLQNETVVDPAHPRLDLPLFHRIVGYSHFASALMVRLAPRFWNSPYWRPAAKLSGEKGSEIGCALMQRLARDAAESKFKVAVIAQYGRDTEFPDLAKVVSCARKASLPVLDFKPIYDETKTKDPVLHSRWFGGGHLSAAGNRFVAARLKEFLREQQVN